MTTKPKGKSLLSLLNFIPFFNYSPKWCRFLMYLSQIHSINNKRTLPRSRAGNIQMPHYKDAAVQVADNSHDEMARKQNVSEIYQQQCKQTACEGTNCCARNGRRAILRGTPGTDSVGPTTGNGFDPRKFFPSKHGLIRRGRSWPCVNHHIQVFQRMCAFLLLFIAECRMDESNPNVSVRGVSRTWSPDKLQSRECDFLLSDSVIWTIEQRACPSRINVVTHSQTCKAHTHCLPLSIRNHNDRLLNANRNEHNEMMQMQHGLGSVCSYPRPSGWTQSPSWRTSCKLGWGGLQSPHILPDSLAAERQ